MDVNLLIIQFNTALKPWELYDIPRRCFNTIQFNTALKQNKKQTNKPTCFNTIQFNTALKPQTMKFCHYCSRCAIQK